MIKLSSVLASLVLMVMIAMVAANAGQKPGPGAWFKNARFWVTLEISARTSIGPALERVYANPG